MPGAVILPFGTEPNHHTWLHARMLAPVVRETSVRSLGCFGSDGDLRRPPAVEEERQP